jgi:hypothetical protein
MRCRSTDPVSCSVDDEDDDAADAEMRVAMAASATPVTTNVTVAA